MGDHRSKSGLAAAVLAGLLIGMATGPAAAQPAGEAGGGDVVGEETAEAYNEWIEGIPRHLDRMAKDIAERYELDEAGREKIRELIQDRADGFLREHGRAAFEMWQRGEALREIAKETETHWRDLPQDIKRDFVLEALPLMEAMQEALVGVADDAERKMKLNPEQLQQLRRERKKMKWGFRMARFRMRMEAGLADPEDRPRPPEGQEAPPAEARRPGGPPGARA
jgi:hypothetical protein